VTRRKYWLCPDDLDRARVLENIGLRAHWVGYLMATAAALLTAGRLGWTPAIVGLSCVPVIEVLLQLAVRSDHPERLAFIAMFVPQVGIAAAVVMTGGPTSPILILMVMVVPFTATFVARGAAIGLGTTVVLLIVAAAIGNIQETLTFPPLFLYAIVAVMTVGLACITFSRAEGRWRITALVDDLTGMLNRRILPQRVAELAQQAVVSGGWVSGILCDVDKFKAINDELGHACGDQVLREVSALMRTNLRTFELVYRIGGDEFFVVLPNTRPDHAYKVAERLRSVVERAHPGGLSLTMSFGVSALAGPEVELNRLMKEADDALYEAKRGGRDQCALHAALRDQWLGEVPAPGGSSADRVGSQHGEITVRAVDGDGVALDRVPFKDRQGDPVT
jgi:diguanylate cyclase (GGDEF)-like protein